MPVRVKSTGKELEEILNRRHQLSEGTGEAHGCRNSGRSPNSTPSDVANASPPERSMKAAETEISCVAELVRCDHTIEESKQCGPLHNFSADAAAIPFPRKSEPNFRGPRMSNASTVSGKTADALGICRLDSSSDSGGLSSLPSSPSTRVRSPCLEPGEEEQRNTPQRQLACIWSSRARMCDAVGKQTGSCLAPITEAEWLRRLNAELMGRLRQDTDAKIEIEKERMTMEANTQIAELMGRLRQDTDAKIEIAKERMTMEANTRIEAARRHHELAMQAIESRLAQEVDRSQKCMKLGEDLKRSCARELQRLKQAHEAELSRLRAETGQLRKELQEASMLNQAFKASNARHEKQRLEGQRSRPVPENTPEDGLTRESPAARCGRDREPSPPTTSEGRLRAALAGHSVTIEELREAICAEEALLGQAKRELGALELHQRRAAYERLHGAVESDQERPLEEAIGAARRWGVGAEELEMAESKLDQLRSLSSEQRAAQAAQKRLAEAKREAFKVVKRGEVAALRELIKRDGGLEAWKSWKDHAGRNLLAYAQLVGTDEVKEFLERSSAAPRPSGSEHPPDTPVTQVLASIPHPASAESDVAAMLVREDLRQEAEKAAAGRAAVKDDTAALASTPHPARADSGVAAMPVGEDPQQEADRAEAFRAVVKDDTAALAQVLERQPPDVWKRWHNRAGKDLLGLSEERCSPSCYTMLARSMGILQERRLQAFDENETVWVFSPGQVAPMHATVLEDTACDAAEVLVEFWDLDQPRVKVEHCLVLKSN